MGNFISFLMIQELYQSVKYGPRNHELKTPRKVLYCDSEESSYVALLLLSQFKWEKLYAETDPS